MLLLQRVFHVAGYQGTSNLIQRGRRGAALAGDWIRRHPFLLPLLILIAGGAFRFYNLNWDDGQLLHPDERWIYMVVSGSTNDSNGPISWPSSLAQFLDNRPKVGSPLDPHFFAYGTLPFYLLALLAGLVSFLGRHLPFVPASWATVDTYGGLTLLGRGLSAALDLLSVGLVFLIARRIYGYWTAVLAMALTAFTVLDIQLSHFYAVDTVLLPLVLLTILAAVVIVQTDRRSTYVWAGIAFGAAMATKTTALLLVIPLAAAAILAAWDGQQWPEEGSLPQRTRLFYGAIRQRLNRNLFWLLASYYVAAITFVVCEPYAILDRATLVRDITEQSNILVTNTPPFGVPYTIQYANTIPYLYQLKNLLFWGMGIPLALAAFAGVLFALVRNLGIRVRPAEAVLLLWVVPYFLFVGRFLAKFDRYMLPIEPVMTLLGAAFLVWAVRERHPGGTRWIRRAGWAAIGLAAGVSFLYSVAYMNIYAHPNTRVAASDWIYSHIRPGSTIAWEGAWDDQLPLGEPGHSPLAYKMPGLNLYDPDTPAKVQHVASILAGAQYLVMSSERMIGSIPRLPDRYPMTSRYYRLLLAGKLGYRLVEHFTAHPAIGPIVVQDYGADESFHVYDHPDVRIFQRVAPVTTAELASVLSNPSATAGYPLGVAPQPSPESSPPAAHGSALLLTGKQWRADQTGPTMDEMFPPAGFAMRHPTVVWLVVLELLGLIAFPFTFLLLRNLLDR
ncbi:MAG: glycosyltransferase family 39 protein, partial [Chloroflexi bacterium]|nr:glycosyltransferase family 39 protein [Chloroflexota bacterium]